LAVLTCVTLASINNALPEDGVTAPKHVGAIFLNFNIVFETVTFALVGE